MQQPDPAGASAHSAFVAHKREIAEAIDAATKRCQHDQNERRKQLLAEADVWRRRCGESGHVFTDRSMLTSIGRCAFCGAMPATEESGLVVDPL